MDLDQHLNLSVSSLVHDTGHRTPPDTGPLELRDADELYPHSNNILPVILEGVCLQVNVFNKNILRH